MAMRLVCSGGVSFRGVSKIFVALNLSLHLNLRAPSHATVLVWMKKQGIANFRERDFFAKEKWVLIIDESVQFGNKKLLVVVAIKENEIKAGSPIRYKDLIPLIIKASGSWKSDEIGAEIKSCINLDNVSYSVSDNGNNLKGCYQLTGLLHIEDIGHKFSWFMKQVFEKYPDFEEYTKHLPALRGKLSLSKIGFVLQYRAFILQTNHLLSVLNSVQQTLKINHLCDATKKECLRKLDEIKDTIDKNIGESLLAKRNELFKKVG